MVTGPHGETGEIVRYPAGVDNGEGLEHVQTPHRNTTAAPV